MDEPMTEAELAGGAATRRDVLKQAAVGAAVLGSVPLWARPAQAGRAATTKPLKIGFFGSFTGPLALSGLDLRRGFELFLEARGNTLLGRPVEVVFEDDASNPALALQKVRKLTEQDRVAIIAGGVNAAAGPPVFDYVNSVGMPWINSLIAADTLTQKLASRNTYMIRLGESASQAAHYLGEYARKTLKYKRVVTVGTDFLFGHENVSGFQDVFQRLGGTVPQKLWIPLGASDHTPFISRIDRNVDAVYAAFAAVDAIRFMTTYQQLGLKGTIPLIGNYTLTDEVTLAATGLPKGSADGVITAARYSSVLDSAENRDFQRRYNAKYSGVSVGSSTAADGWITGQFIEAAIKRRNGDTSNRRKFTAAFIGLKLDTPRGQLEVAKDRSTICPTYIRRVVPTTGKVPPGYSLTTMNQVLRTIPRASQYWKFQVAGYLARPAYSRDHPPARG
jgi:branched-chain amino acid transport system substrate-binding protein